MTRDGALTPSVNDCVAALPVAQTLAGTGAHVERLRRFSLPETQRVLTRLAAPPLVPTDATPAERASIAAERAAASASPRANAMTGPRPCLLVFTGSFSLAGVRAASGHPAAAAVTGPATGGYLLVITTTRHPRVLRAVIAAKDPLA